MFRAVKERRYAPRVMVSSSVRIWTGSREVQGRVVDVSTRGIAVDTPCDVVLDRFVRLRATLEPSSQPIDLDAIVLRRERRGGSMRWGLELHEPPSHVLARLVEFVRRELGSAESNSSSAPEATVERTVHGENARVRGLYEQALSDF